MKIISSKSNQCEASGTPRVESRTTSKLGTDQSGVAKTGQLAGKGFVGTHPVLTKNLSTDQWEIFRIQFMEVRKSTIFQAIFWGDIP